MNNLSLFAFSGLLIIIFYIPLVYLSFKFSNNRVAKFLSLHFLFILMWGICSFFIGLNLSNFNYVFLWQAAFLFIIFIPFFLLITILEVLKLLNKPFFLFITFLTLLVYFIFLIYHDFSSISFNKLTSSYYLKADNIYSFFLFYWLLIVSLPHLLFLKSYNFFITKKENIIWILFTLVGFLGGISNFLTAYFDAFFPIGNFLIPFHAIVCLLLLFKSKLISIKPFWTSDFTHSILFSLMILVVIIYLISFEKLIQNFIGYNTFEFSIITTFLITLLISPFFQKLRNFVDRYIYKSTTEELANQNEYMKQEIALTEKYKSLGTVAVGIAHEIKNPLTAMKVFTEYFPERKNDPKFIERFTRIMKNETARINDLVLQLMNYGKPRELELAPVTIHSLIDGLLETLKAQAISREVQLDTHYEADVEIQLSIDNDMIYQALMNVIQNAVEILQPDDAILVKTSCKDNWFIIAVEDNGPGIPKENLTRIFDPFFSSRKDESTGMGLAITKNIIESHGGMITVRSEEGKGCEIVMFLPFESTNKNTRPDSRESTQ